MNAKILPLGTVCSIISPLTLRWISIEARGRGAGAGGTRPLVCPLVMSECIIYEKSRTRLVGGRDGVRYIRAIQVNKTREGGTGPAGEAEGEGGEWESAGKEFHQFLKRSLAGEKEWAERAITEDCARRASLLFRISTRRFPPVVKLYFICGSRPSVRAL